MMVRVAIVQKGPILFDKEFEKTAQFREMAKKTREPCTVLFATENRREPHDDWVDCKTALKNWIANFNTRNKWFRISRDHATYN